MPVRLGAGRDRFGVEFRGRGKVAELVGMFGCGIPSDPDGYIDRFSRRFRSGTRRVIACLKHECRKFSSGSGQFASTWTINNSLRSIGACSNF